jgi:hypothetical protein
MVRVGPICVEMILTRGVGPVGNLAIIIKDEDGDGDVHKLVDVHFVLEGVASLLYQGEELCGCDY